MAQIFSAEATVSAQDTALPNGTSTPVVTLNALNPRFTNCKAKFIASGVFAVSADNTQLSLSVLRNPGDAAVSVASFSIDLLAAAAGNVPFTFCGVDIVANEGSVVYQLLAEVLGGAGDGSALQGCYFEATLISG